MVLPETKIYVSISSLKPLVIAAKWALPKEETIQKANPNPTNTKLPWNNYIQIHFIWKLSDKYVHKLLV